VTTTTASHQQCIAESCKGDTLGSTV